MKIRIKKGDTVKVLVGKDRGKSGKVLDVFPKIGRLTVEGINIHTRFSRPRKQGEKGQRLELPAAMYVSKVMLVCPNCGRTTRIAHDKTQAGNMRKCVHCGKIM